METVKKLNGLTEIVLNNAIKYMEKNKLTKEQFAGEIGVSRPVLSKAMNYKYDGNIDNVESTIIEYLKEKGEYSDILPTESEKDVKNIDERPDFYKTKDAANIIGICKAAQEQNGLGIIVGNSGYGKSYTLRQYSKLSKVCYIECDDTMSTKDLVEAIQKNIGIPSTYGTVWKRLEGIKDFFNINQGYVIIIDEADKLINRSTQKKLELLRAIFDQCKVGLVIAGEPQLEIVIKTYLNRFANRIDFYTKLGGLSKSEVKAYLEYFNITEDAANELIVRATETQVGCFRLLDRTLKNIFRIIGKDEEITSEIISKASNMMML